MSLPSLDDGDDSVYDVEYEILCDLSRFVLDSEFWCHESHGERFCSADPQVEGRTALWTCVYNDDAHDDSEQRGFSQSICVGRGLWKAMHSELMNNGFASAAKNATCTGTSYSYNVPAIKSDRKASLSLLMEVFLAKGLRVPEF